MNRDEIRTQLDTIKQQITAGAFVEAFALLRAVAQPDHDFSLQARYGKLMRSIPADELGLTPLRIAVLGGSTVDHFVGVLEWWLAREGFAPAFYLSEYDTIQTARAAAAFKFHLDLHLKKEDAHLYRLFRERIPMPEQAKAVGEMSSTVPQERFPEVVAWMFPLMGNDDRENMTRIWQTVMPAPVFAGVKGLISKVIGDDWTELTRRIPTLLD